MDDRDIIARRRMEAKERERVSNMTLEAQIVGVDIATGWKMLIDMKHKGQAGGSAFGAELFAEELRRRINLYSFYSDHRGLMTPTEIIDEMLHELGRSQ